jgi:PTH1 family peptidyl-tRNA hydrolase
VRLIIGLGNPGKEYERTKHNVGFWAIDVLGSQYRIELKPTNMLVYAGQGTIEGIEVVLAKPVTFMNRSGLAVQQMLAVYQALPHDLIILHDEIDLPPGKVRVKWRGGDAGHKGIRSIIVHLGTDEFLRIRIGVGRPVLGVEVVDYVLSSFAAEEGTLVEQVIATVVMEQIVGILRGKIRDPKQQESAPCE